MLATIRGTTWHGEHSVMDKRRRDAIARQEAQHKKDLADMQYFKEQLEQLREDLTHARNIDHSEQIIAHIKELQLIIAELKNLL